MMSAVLDVLHVPAPSMDGVSLVALMTHETVGPRCVLEIGVPAPVRVQRAARASAGRYEFLTASRPELVDLDVDAGEQPNTFNEREALSFSHGRKTGRARKVRRDRQATGETVRPG